MFLISSADSDLLSRLPYLHPGTEQEYAFTIFVPREQQSIPLVVLVSATDVPLEQIDLTANVDKCTNESPGA
jgi:hypothetical protein